MDYIGNKCPVCDKYFHVGDDVVVCPECGTPHHRECYNHLRECANTSKHKDGYDYQQDLNNSTEDDGEFIICKKCSAKNDSSAFFCSKCGNSLHEIPNSQQNPYVGNNQNTPPFSQNGTNVIMFDPLAGVNPNTDLGDGVTVGETAKFVKQNTPYFITIFNNIKNFSKSRFNFCAAIFGGGYLLFRKMYKLGAIITAIQAALIVLELYINYYITSSGAFDKYFEALYTYDTNAAMLHFSKFSEQEMSVLLIYYAISVTMLVMCIVVGACANRMYFNHCKKSILKIKNTVDISENRDDILKKRGGVNAPLAISLWISYMIISYLPVFFY
ncbi:MAG: DUF2628 domain-containing protein [Ruminococcus sp.]|nr:DUF2628 domain-containing protein [Ruminococcus sp.]